MVGMFVSSAVWHEFEPWSRPTEYYQISICCSSVLARSINKKKEKLFGSESL
jgi:hypothetical protein